MASGSITEVGLIKGADDFAAICIDAHGGFNTEITSGTGNMRGVRLSYLMGYGEADTVNFWSASPLSKPQNIYFLGARALDPGEIETAAKLNMYIRSSEQLSVSDPAEVIADILPDIKRKGIDHIHPDFGVDVIDPEYTPGAGVPEKRDIPPILTYTPIRLCMQLGLVKSVDIVELNTDLDQGRIAERAIQRVFKIILE